MRIELTKLILGGTRITYQATGDAVLEDRKRYTFAMGLLIVELSVQLLLIKTENGIPTAWDRLLIWLSLQFCL